jgi:hypothetical protein
MARNRNAAPAVSGRSLPVRTKYRVPKRRSVRIRRRAPSNRRAMTSRRAATSLVPRMPAAAIGRVAIAPATSVADEVGVGAAAVGARAEKIRSMAAFPIRDPTKATIQASARGQARAKAPGLPGPGLLGPGLWIQAAAAKAAVRRPPSRRRASGRRQHPCPPRRQPLRRLRAPAPTINTSCGRQLRATRRALVPTTGRGSRLKWSARACQSQRAQTRA